MIQVNDLRFSYGDIQQSAIRDLSFTIEPGEVFGFLGPSGAGKSTTQKILIGLLTDYSGDVAVFGRSLKEWGSDYYERIGVSFEFPNHFLKLTANENLRYFAAMYAGKTCPPQDLLSLVGLEGEGDQLVSRYSKGMKNRLSVARSLLHGPELLFLDEPTAGLDPVNANRIADLIRAQKDVGRTVFLTTHDMAIAEDLCDRVALIVDGEIALIDAPRRLKIEHGKPSVCVEWRDAGRLVSTTFPLDGLGHDSDFTRLLRDKDVETIHTQEASLADIFIQVTGQGLV